MHLAMTRKMHRGPASSHQTSYDKKLGIVTGGQRKFKFISDDQIISHDGTTTFAGNHYEFGYKEHETN